MAEEHPARTGASAPDPTRAFRHGGPAGRRSPETRQPGPADETRTGRRHARAQKRRRHAVEVVAALTGLLALVAYVNWWSEPEPHDRAEPDGLPAVVGGPRLPSLDPAAPAVPGLRPRERSPSPSPSPSPSSTRVPAPPVAPMLLTVTRSDIPATVNLTEVGRRDWVHWGLGGAGTVVRKHGGSAEIRDLGGSGERGGWDGNQELFRWRDGAPTRSVEATRDGVYACGTGSGFELAVVSDGQPRTVSAYLGVWMARGRLEARLTGGGPRRTLRLEERHTSQSTVAKIRFQAPKGARLLLTWSVEETFTPHCGNVGLQAVALR